VAINLDILKSERDKLKQGLRELEADQRKLEVKVKEFRQREIHIKREIEALATLIEIAESKTTDSSELKTAETPSQGE
jgi:chromosome segregation ATPase